MATVKRSRLDTLAACLEIDVQPTFAAVTQLDLRDRYFWMRNRFAEQVEAHCAGYKDARLARKVMWAMAFNMSRNLDKRGERIERASTDDWTCDQYVADFAATPANGGRSRLAELVASVACEQRADWQHPLCRTIDRGCVEKSWEVENARFCKSLLLKVVAELRRYQIDLQHKEDIYQDAVFTAWRKTWGPASQVRFRGDSTIGTYVSSFVCGTVWNFRGKERRLRTKFVMAEIMDRRQSPEHSGDVTPAIFDKIIEDAINRMTPLDGQIFILKNDPIQRFTQRKIAKLLGRNEQFISDHLNGPIEKALDEACKAWERGDLS